MNGDDEYRLRDGTRGGWEAVGRKHESRFPRLTDYISYDEMLLSALTAVSSPSHFINNGARGNKGVLNGNKDHQLHGIQYSAVGPRFERNKVMERSLMMVDYWQNTVNRGYGDYNDRDTASALVKASDDKYFLEQLQKSKERSGGLKRPIFTLYELFYGVDYF